MAGDSASNAPPPSQARRRLKTFTVTGLFGLFDHELELRTDDRITIIHGPNGVGKTTVLRLIEALLHPHSSLWRKTDFSKVTAEFLPSGSLSVRPVKSNDKAGVKYRLTLDGARKGQEEFFHEDPEIPRHVVEGLIPHLRRFDDNFWQDMRDGEMISFDEVVRRYGGTYFPAEFSKKKKPLPDWLASFFEGFSTQFIQTQRLRVDGHDSHSKHGRRREHAVEGLAEDLTRRIRESVRESGALGASLDRTFPKRLLEGTLPSEATADSIRETYQNLEKSRRRMMDAGLLSAEEQVPLPTTELSADERKVLWYYLSDVRKKLGVHSSLLERIELFKRIIDEKNFLYKTMHLDTERGLRFISATNRRVPLPALSSGEQHELVLTYELLFKSKGKQLILIDEPELSLHVIWQQRFLQDMEEIARVANLDFIIATHSPSIVNHRTDLMVELARKHA